MSRPERAGAKEEGAYIMKRILIAGSALALIAAPASAQLLGGGGLGGVLGGGGAAGGVLGGTLGGFPPQAGLPSLPGDPIGGTLGGSANGSASGSGSAHANRHTGHVDANGHGNANGNGTLNGVLNTPAASGSGSGHASGSASGGGSASADLIGTDAVRSTAQGVVSQARGTASGVVGNAYSTAGNLAGSASGNANGAASGSAGYASGALAAAGSAASSAQGAFSVQKGMNVLDTSGDKIGTVRQVIANGQGQVQQLLVKVHGAQATLPASNFSANGNGNAVISAMGQGTIRQIAQQQSNPGQ
jgi:hypothetical protein